MPDHLAVVRRWVELDDERDDVTGFCRCSTPTSSSRRRALLDSAAATRPASVRRGVRDRAARILPDRFVKAGDVVAGLGRTEVRWIESGEVAREVERAGVFWLRGGRIRRVAAVREPRRPLRAAALAG